MVCFSCHCLLYVPVVAIVVAPAEEPAKVLEVLEELPPPLELVPAVNQPVRIVANAVQTRRLPRRFCVPGTVNNLFLRMMS